VEKKRLILLQLPLQTDGRIEKSSMATVKKATQKSEKSDAASRSPKNSSILPATSVDHSTEALRQALRTYFGFDQFKGNQERIIQSVLSGKDTFVIKPTARVCAINSRH
jgi:ATP-dependent DNA helicase RecQ